MSLKYIPAPNSESPLYIAAVDSGRGMREVELYAWQGNQDAVRIGSHYPGLSGKNLLGFRNGLVKLAEFVESSNRAGVCPVFYEPRPDVVRSSRSAEARGEEVVKYRPLSSEEMLELRKIQKIPALKLAA